MYLWPGFWQDFRAEISPDSCPVEVLQQVWGDSGLSGYVNMISLTFFPPYRHDMNVLNYNANPEFEVPWADLF